MFLIIGLGNPGEKFEKTKHNVGRMIISKFATTNKLSDFVFEKKLKSLITTGKIGKEKVLLALPETFMNKSGEAAGPLKRWTKTKNNQIFVIHDDADLPLGRGKISFGRSSGGHKGVESVMRNLKTQDFVRFRIGIGAKKHKPAEDMVLKKISPADEKILNPVIKKAVQALRTAIEEGYDRAMNDFNQ